MRSPYQDLPPSRYWRSGVSQAHVLDIPDLYVKKFAIGPADRIATAGSCVAQHISRNMRARGFSVIDAEPAPEGLDEATAQAHGYGQYSARYGNVYTSRQLIQLAREALGQFTPANAVWEKDGRFYDALRPSVEPDGLRSAAHVALHRRQHLARVAEVLRSASVFVFTLGLTETWIDRASGTVYPTAPGTIAGSHDPAVTAFHNLTTAEVLEDMLAFRDLMRGINPAIRFLLTVSPVPLTATAASDHVLVATTYSKSVLRAVAGELQQRFDDVDYFPSYEIIASPPARGFFYDPNLRTVNKAGVAHVMRTFFAAHGTGASPPTGPTQKPAEEAEEDAVVCEEALLEAFAR